MGHSDCLDSKRMGEMEALKVVFRFTLTWEERRAWTLPSDFGTGK